MSQGFQTETPMQAQHGDFGLYELSNTPLANFNGDADDDIIGLNITRNYVPTDEDRAFAKYLASNYDPAQLQGPPMDMGQDDLPDDHFYANVQGGSAPDHVAGPSQPNLQTGSTNNAPAKAVSKAKREKGKINCLDAPPWLECLDPETNNYVPAVRHSDIRNQLIQEADQEAAQYEGYDHKPAQGADRWDKTSFVVEHKTWGSQRRHRPEINFIFDKPSHPLPRHIQPDARPEKWLWNGAIVLDHDDRPMRHFKGVPTTLASCVEGFRLDAIHKGNPQILAEDLVGRLPLQHHIERADGSLRRVDLVSAPGLTNVAMRWRWEAGILSWSPRSGSDATKRFLEQFLSAEQVQRNSTRGGRDLTKEEVKELQEYKKDAKRAADAGQAIPPAPRRVIAAKPARRDPRASTHTELPAPKRKSVIHASLENQKIYTNHQHRPSSYEAVSLDLDHVDLLDPKTLQSNHEEPHIMPANPNQVLESINDQHGIQLDSLHLPGNEDVRRDLRKRPYFEMADVDGNDNYQSPLYHRLESEVLDDQLMSGTRSIHRLKQRSPTDAQACLLPNSGARAHPSQGNRNRLLQYDDEDTMILPQTNLGITASPAAKKRRLDDVTRPDVSLRGQKRYSASHQFKTRRRARRNGPSAGLSVPECEPSLEDPLFATPDDSADCAAKLQANPTQMARAAPMPERQIMVPPGSEPVCYPVDEPVIMFSTADEKVSYGIIKANGNTEWDHVDFSAVINDLARLQEGARQGGQESLPQLEFAPEQEPRQTSYPLNIREGYEAIMFPTGAAMICLSTRTKIAQAGVIRPYGKTVWNDLSLASVIDVLRHMEDTRQNPPREALEPPVDVSNANLAPANNLEGRHNCTPLRSSPDSIVYADVHVPTANTTPPEQAQRILSTDELMLFLNELDAANGAATSPKAPKGSTYAPSPPQDVGRYELPGPDTSGKPHEIFDIASEAEEQNNGGIADNFYTSSFLAPHGETGSRSPIHYLASNNAEYFESYPEFDLQAAQKLFALPVPDIPGPPIHGEGCSETADNTHGVEIEDRSRITLEELVDYNLKRGLSPLQF